MIGEFKKNRFNLIEIVLGCIVSGLAIFSAVVLSLKFYFTAVGNDEWAPLAVQKQVQSINQRVLGLEYTTHRLLDETKKNNERILRNAEARDKITAEIKHEVSRIQTKIDTQSIINSATLDALRDLKTIIENQ